MIGYMFITLNSPRQPIALRFPAGQGTKFQQNLHQTWQIILKQLERRFTAETYHNRIEAIRQQTGDVQQQALIELTSRRRRARPQTDLP